MAQLGSIEDSSLQATTTRHSTLMAEQGGLTGDTIPVPRRPTSTPKKLPSASTIAHPGGEAAPPSPVSRITVFAPDFGLSIAAFAVAACGLFLGHDHGHGLVGLGHVAAVDRQYHHLVVACAPVIVGSGIPYAAVRELFITLRLMKLLLAVDIPPSILSLGLPPPIEVLTASVKTPRAPIGASPLDVG
ncbi:hypothetical protein LZ31DRAFT_591652 [Colletotrichum somersetense]|nr:hypothetical protein LZ31DRAFT_591652 [Colletotrichum somersetense]